MTTEIKSPAAKKKDFSVALAAFIAGAGLGAGTTITVQSPGPERAGWRCEVMVNDQVLCSPIESVFVEDSILVDVVDAGASPDNSTAAVVE